MQLLKRFSKTCVYAIILSYRRYGEKFGYKRNLGVFEELCQARGDISGRLSVSGSFFAGGDP